MWCARSTTSLHHALFRQGERPVLRTRRRPLAALGRPRCRGRREVAHHAPVLDLLEVREGRHAVAPLAQLGAAVVGGKNRVPSRGVQRQLLLPVDDDHFCRFRSSWIENQPGPEHAAARGVLRLRRSASPWSALSNTVPWWPRIRRSAASRAASPRPREGRGRPGRPRPGRAARPITAIRAAGRAACHPQGRSGAEDVRSTLTRWPSRSYASPTSRQGLSCVAGSANGLQMPGAQRPAPSAQRPAPSAQRGFVAANRKPSSVV